MKRRWLRIALAVTGVAAAVAIWIAADSASARKLHFITCKSIETEILDSMERRFVSPGDIATFLEDYGPWMGQRVEDVDASRMESVLDSKGAIRKSNVWVGYDGVIHVQISQREPVIRFQCGDMGWYADISGFIFPIQERFSVRVPIVDGRLPLDLVPGFKGAPESPEQKEWLSRMVALASEMDGQWGDRISQITVQPSGDLIMIPREGSERFIFGQPTGIKEKFSKLKAYYECVAPQRTTQYKTVDLRYKGQLVCR